MERLENSAPSPFAVASVDGPSVEQDIAIDMIKKAAWIAPVAMTIGAIFWGAGGLISAGYAILIIAVNFMLSAILLSWSARISLAMVGFAALFGYILRLGLIFLAVWLVKDLWWVEALPLGLTLILTHLGLLFWEMKHVSASLAFPGLKPEPADAFTSEAMESTDQ